MRCKILDSVDEFDNFIVFGTPYSCLPTEILLLKKDHEGIRPRKFYLLRMILSFELLSPCYRIGTVITGLTMNRHNALDEKSRPTEVDSHFKRLHSF